MATKKTKEELIKDLFNSVQEQKLAIEKAETSCWKTSGNFGYSANSAHDRTEIRIITNPSKIVDMLAFLIDRKEKSEKAAERLKVEYDFKWLGFTLEEWEEDFKTRVNQINIQKRRLELAESEAKLKSISPELRDSLELDYIEKLVNKK